MILADCKKILINNLKDLIKNDYVLLDLPYFTNVGDVLIWQSTKDLLKAVPYKCLYSSSIESYRKPDITKDVLILFMGGGNFGDLWIRHQNFRQRVISDFPENPIIQLPQSVCFNSTDYLNKDILLFSKHKAPITICLRDEKSFLFIKSHYTKVSVRLMPDMVLGFDVSKYTKLQAGAGSLFVSREDSEKAELPVNVVIPKDADCKDWPSMEQEPLYIRIYKRVQLVLARVDKHYSTHFCSTLADFCFKNFFRKWIINSGLNFIKKYKVVYSTRLHAAILALLMEKNVVVFDNSYGKIKGVYNLWLKEQIKIKMV